MTCSSREHGSSKGAAPSNRQFDITSRQMAEEPEPMITENRLGRTKRWGSRVVHGAWRVATGDQRLHGEIGDL